MTDAQGKVTDIRLTAFEPAGGLESNLFSIPAPAGARSSRIATFPSQSSTGAIVPLTFGVCVANLARMGLGIDFPSQSRRRTLIPSGRGVRDDFMPGAVMRAGLFL